MTRIFEARFWRDPFFVMGIVLIMYALKVLGKITVGEAINSPMISGDGFHNIADLFEAMAVMVVVYLARRKPNAEFPFGLKQIEYLTSLLIGCTLIAVAFNFALESVVGLLAQAPSVDLTVRNLVPVLPEFQPLVMSNEHLPWILLVTGGSAFMSLLVSRYQILIGKASGHQSLVADGQETWSDGRIELVVLTGVICEYLFHASWIEYPLGLFVAYLVVKTAWSLIKTGWSGLLLRSIGAEHEEEIERICLNTAGVMALESLKTFHVGSSAVVMLTLSVRAESYKAEHIKYGVETAILSYLEEQEYKGSELQVKFSMPDPERHRIAFAVVKKDGLYIIADGMQDASHILVCNVAGDEIVRTKLFDKGQVPIVVLKKKRVRSLYMFKPGPDEEELASQIEVCTSPCYMLASMGVPL